jgi:hypothetical protein
MRNVRQISSMDIRHYFYKAKNTTATPYQNSDELCDLDQQEGNKENSNANVGLGATTTTPLHSSTAKDLGSDIIDLSEIVDTPPPLQRKLVDNTSTLQQILHHLAIWSVEARRIGTPGIIPRR